MPRSWQFAIALFLALFVTILAAPRSGAFTPPEDMAGPLTVRIANPGDVTALEKPVAVPVTLVNAGDAALTGTLKVWVTDDWRVGTTRVKEMSLPFSVPAKGEKTLPVTVTAGKGTYAALYPVHARAEASVGGQKLAPHAILILSVTPEAVATAAGTTALPVQRLSQALRLDTAGTFQVRYNIGGGPVQSMPPGWQGSDAKSGTSVSIQETDRGDRRRAIGVHPPWRAGWGETYIDYKVALPAGKKVTLLTATAIRDSNASEPQSDGVDFRVLVDDGSGFKERFARFSTAKSWEPARVDLSAYAGKQVTLRLFTGSGPAHNTSVDQSFWAEPMLLAGEEPKPEAASAKSARMAQATSAARAAAGGAAGQFQWKLDNGLGVWGAAVVPGPNGMADAAIALSDGTKVLTFDGFPIEIDNRAIGAVGGWVPGKVDTKWENGRMIVDHRIDVEDKAVTARVQLWAEKGALRVAFSMPGAVRDAQGSPRYTKLHVGPLSEPVRRMYAGFGSVLDQPGRVDLRAGGFTLSTRHVGADFPSGISLVQATDIFPDVYSVDPATNRCALVTHHDATFSFFPSTKGAFAAARVYRQIAGFKPAPGVDRLLGRMCLDQWGGDYARAAEDLEKAGRYGLNDSIFVKHVWQRWGYDYRLPEIYPPSGNFADFQKMVAASKKNGILFCPHDNYIDFYPDAEGYSYDHIIFNPDGTPQKAWFNEGRQALSYRWLPTAFAPWQAKNLKLMKEGFAPDALFVDVFTAIPPIDFYDRQGRFYPKTVTQKEWGESFDRARTAFGNNAPQLSEAGTDALIGHLDGSQSDHSGWVSPDDPSGEGRNRSFSWRLPAKDGERTPWHDMATHGSFVLLAGGLGPRYAGGQDDFLHGYASDDYLSLTVLGGRNPMSDGPFSRRTVMTYWLLHDLSAKLARSEMLTHQFADDDIHRQIVTFSGDAKVTVNRGKTDWTVDGTVLPPYGFTATSGNVQASITRRGGVIAGFSRAPGVIFADARPVAGEGGMVRMRVLGVDQTGRTLRVRMEWDVLQPVGANYRPFMHFVDESKTTNEGIAFQGAYSMDTAALGRAGTVQAIVETTLPENLTAPATFAIRPGMYDPQGGGGRLRLAGAIDGTGRARGGRIVVEMKNGQPVATWQPEPPDPDVAAREARINAAGTMVDFGPVATNGAFRLKHAGMEWELMPLPSSKPFGVSLDLAALGASSANPTVTAIDIDGKPVGTVSARRSGNRLEFTTGEAFAYKIRL